MAVNIMFPLAGPRVVSQVRLVRIPPPPPEHLVTFARAT